VDALFYSVRFLHYVAALQLFGVTVFEACVAPAALSHWLYKPSRRVAVASAWALLLSGILWLMLQAGNMGDGWEDAVNPGVIGTVLAATDFGHVWVVRLLLAAILVAAMALSDIRSKVGWSVQAVLAALTVGSLGLVGHAAIDTGVLGFLNEGSQVLHLLSSAFWVGSLLPLVFCLRALADPVHASDADVTLHRFSGLGHFAVAIVLGTGATNTWFILGSSIDLASPYEMLLFAKVALVTIMIGLALVNRYLFMPTIPDGTSGVRYLRDGTITEIGISVGVIGLVSILGVLAPQ